jgi:hypothetical protein
MYREVGDSEEITVHGLYRGVGNSEENACIERPGIVKKSVHTDKYLRSLIPTQKVSSALTLPTDT